MFTASANFDIADLKRSSVKMKGALQAEWQEVIRTAAPTADSNVDFGTLDLIDEQTQAFLPRIDLTLKLSGNAGGVSFVPSLSSMQNQNGPQITSFTNMALQNSLRC